MSEPRGSERATPMADELAWTPVLSSNIAAVAVEGRSLYVRFLDGSVYRFAGAGELGPQLVAGTGRFFHRHIRGRYPSEKLE